MSRISAYPQVSQLNGTELVLIDAGSPKKTSTITTANLSANILSNNLVSALPAFNAMINANQTVGSGATADIVWNTSIFQQGSGYSTSTGIFTAPTTGLYRFDALVNLTSPASATSAQAWFSKNNGILSSSFGLAFAFYSANTSQLSGSNAGFANSGSVTIQLSVNDTVRVKVQNTGASTLNVFGAANSPYGWFSCLMW